MMNRYKNVLNWEENITDYENDNMNTILHTPVNSHIDSFKGGSAEAKNEFFGMECRKM